VWVAMEGVGQLKRLLKHDGLPSTEVADPIHRCFEQLYCRVNRYRVGAEN